MPEHRFTNPRAVYGKNTSMPNYFRVERGVIDIGLNYDHRLDLTKEFPFFYFLPFKKFSVGLVSGREIADILKRSRVLERASLRTMIGKVLEAGDVSSRHRLSLPAVGARIESAHEGRNNRVVIDLDDHRGVLHQERESYLKRLRQITELEPPARPNFNIDVTMGYGDINISPVAVVEAIASVVVGNKVILRSVNTAPRLEEL